MSIQGNPQNIMLYQEEIRKKLIERAKQEKTFWYSDLFSPYGLDMSIHSHNNAAAELLGRISEEEHSRGCPLLSVVVVQKSGEDAGHPGGGFFELAKSLDLFGGGKKASKTAKDGFFIKTIKKVYKYWKNHEPD